MTPTAIPATGPKLGLERWLALLLASGLALGCGGASALGDDPQGAKDVSFLVAFPACQSDYNKLCSGIDPIKHAPRAIQCLRSHESDLNSVCQEQFATSAARRMRRTADACSADRAHFCPEAPTRQEAWACLSEHEEKLTPPCKEMLGAHKKAGRPAGGATPPMGAPPGGRQW